MTSKKRKKRGEWNKKAKAGTPPSADKDQTLCPPVPPFAGLKRGLLGGVSEVWGARAGGSEGGGSRDAPKPSVPPAPAQRSVGAEPQSPAREQQAERPPCVSVKPQQQARAQSEQLQQWDPDPRSYTLLSPRGAEPYLVLRRRVAGSPFLFLFWPFSQSTSHPPFFPFFGIAHTRPPHPGPNPSPPTPEMKPKLNPPGPHSFLASPPLLPIKRGNPHDDDDDERWTDTTDGPPRLPSPIFLCRPRAILSHFSPFLFFGKGDPHSKGVHQSSLLFAHLFPSRIVHL